MTSKRGPYDAIVLGAGPNGLAAATVLARGGRRVAVVEGRDEPGGLAGRREFASGYRVDGVLSDASLVRPWVVRELGLARHGLAFRERPPVLVPGLDGPGMVLNGQARTVTGVSSEDARRYGDFLAFLDRLRPVLAGLLDRRPPDPLGEAHGLPLMGDLLSLARSGLALRRLGKRQMLEVLRVTPLSLRDWLAEWFDSEKLRAALAAPGLEATFAGPYSPGSVLPLMRLAALTGSEVVGGPAAVIDALLRAAESAGVTLETGRQVTQILVRDRVVTGVETEGGEPLRAPLVLATCDPRQTLLKLLPASAISGSLAGEIASFRARGTTAKIHLGLAAYPEIASRPGEVFERLRLAGDSVEDLERASDAAKYGRISERPWLEVSFPSVADPSLAPAGHHVASILVHWAPYDLGGGWDAAATSRLYELALERLAEHLPSLRQSIVASEVLTPEDLEAVFGLTGGHLHHGEHALDQLLVRPAPCCARYDTPVRGLFLGGSGSHPGGGVTSAPGALAAKRALEASSAPAAG